MIFRVAFGRCDCRKPYADSIQSAACEIISSRLESWRARLPADLSAVPQESFEDEFVDGHRITLGTHKQQVEDGATLVVLQALVHTWSRPTYVAIGAIGRVYAEGLLVSADGSLVTAPDDLMWSFR